MLGVSLKRSAGVGGVRAVGQAGLCLPLQVPPAKAELPQLPLLVV